MVALLGLLVRQVTLAHKVYLAPVVTWEIQVRLAHKEHRVKVLLVSRGLKASWVFKGRLAL